MACLAIAAWTWVIAWFSLGKQPGWALVFSAIGGFALGLRLMIAVYEERREEIQRARPARRSEGSPARRLKLVRAAGNA
jgi:hypothetical protein